MYSTLRIKKGKYIAVIGYKDENGKWKEHIRDTNLEERGNKRRAEAMLKEFEAEFENGELEKKPEPKELENKLFDYDRILFGCYLLNWLERAKQTIEVSTYAGYKLTIEGRIAPYFNDRQIYLQDLTPQMIDDYYAFLAKDVGNNTIIHHHAIIRKALQEAYVDGYILYNIADRAHRPKKSDFVGSFYNKDEMLHLFKCVKGLPIEFPVLMAGYYGLRRSEVAGLKWSAIDFDYKTITIKHVVTTATVDGKQVMIAKDRTKTKKSLRTLPLMPAIIDLLKAMKEKEALNRRLFGSAYTEQYADYIFKNDIGELINPDFISQNFAIQIKNNHLRKIRFHDLRHSCATLLRHEGVPMEDIQKWLGHSEITTTEKIYAHFDENRHRKSAEKITAAFHGFDDDDD